MEEGGPKSFSLCWRHNWLSLDITGPHSVNETSGQSHPLELVGHSLCWVVYSAPRKLLLEDVAEPEAMLPGPRSKKLSPPRTSSWETGGVNLGLCQDAAQACVVGFAIEKARGRPK